MTFARNMLWRSGAVAATFAAAVVLFIGATPRTAHAAYTVAPIAAARTQAGGMTEMWAITATGSAATNITWATVTFPSSFVIPAAPTVTVTGATACTVSSIGSTSGVVTIGITGACDTSSGLTVMIGGVLNPMVAGTYSIGIATSLDANANATATVAGRAVGSLPRAGQSGLTIASGTFGAVVSAAKQAGCDVEAMWVNNPAGGFLVYVAGSAIGVVNAEAVSTYPNGLGVNQPIVISCR